MNCSRNSVFDLPHLWFRCGNEGLKGVQFPVRQKSQ